VILACWIFLGIYPHRPTSAHAAATEDAGTITPLQEAAILGDIGQMRALLDAGAPIDQRGRFGRTALQEAVIAGKTDAASLLLDRGADPNAPSQFGMTPLHWAAMKGWPEMVGLLARRGGRPDARNAYGMTPLHDAANDEVAQALLAVGAKVSAKDDRGMTPLHTARGPMVVKTLMEAGGDMRVESKDGLTPFDLGVVNALEPAGVSIQSLRAPARLRGALGRTSITIRSVTDEPLDDFAISANSPACVEVEVFPDRIDRLAPAQILPVVLTLFRSPDAAQKEYPLFFTLSSRGKEIGAFDLPLDATKGLTLEDQGWHRLGRANIRPAPSRLRYVAFAVVPLLVVAAWLLARRRSKTKT
jgi:Ankyrin repeats (3 copies)/Ankyrin repeats (many copies)